MTHALPTVDRWADLRGRRILVRCDFNVPIAEVDGRRVVTDDFRIRAATPLLTELRDRGAEVVVATHLGRPKGPEDPSGDVGPVREVLATLCPGVTLRENLRLSPGEESNDEAFGRSLVEGVDGYVNEAFGVSHRAHASIVAPPRYVESAAGPHLVREVTTLLSVFAQPARPFVAVVGGAKVADKLPLLARLVEVADTIVVGGAMAFTFWRAEGRATGASLVDEGAVAACADLLATGRLVLPTDAVALPVGTPFGDGGEAEGRTVVDEVPEGWVALDVGAASTATFADVVRGAATVLWNGPMGVFEDPRFAAGTRTVAQAVADCPGTTIVGGGDSAAALHQFDLASRVSFVSTGGGAALELLEKGDLPGLVALRTSPFNEGA